MRRHGNEAQFTQMIAAACGSDPRFASQFVGVLVRAAGERGAQVAVPSELSCRAEQAVHSLDGRDLGRVDLVFRHEEHFVLLVELKLHSAYGHEQLVRYQEALDTFPGDRRHLMAVTVTSPFSGEAVVRDDPRWLGSVRWSRLFDQLRSIRHRSAAVETTWRAALDLMRRTGDFGPMNIDPSAISAWARALEGEQALKHLLREAATPVEAMLTTPRAAAPHTHVIARGKNKTQPVVPWRGRLHVAYAVASDIVEPRFRIQFLARDGAVSFSCEARYEHPKEPVTSDPSVEAATNRLRTAGFSVGTDYEGWYWAKTTDPSRWFTDNDPLQPLLEFSRTAIEELMASEIWTALADRSPVTPVTSTDQPEESG